MFWRIWRLLQKEIVQLTRDRLLWPVVLIVPVLEVVALAFAAAPGVAHLPIAIYDQDLSRTSREMVAALANSRRFDPDYQAASQEEAERLLDDGTVKAAVLIPPDLSAQLNHPNQEAYVQVLIDGTNANTAAVAQAYAESTISAYMAHRMKDQLDVMARRAGKVEAHPRIWFNQDLRGENFYVPAQMASMLVIITGMLTTLSITRERELGTMEQLLVTPLRGIELVIGKAIPVLIITYVEFLIMLGLALFWFDVPLSGSAVLLMGLTAYYIVIEMGIGLFISTLSRSQGQGLLSSFFVASMAIVLSGYLVPKEHMPLMAQWAARLMPVTYFVEILRGVLLKAATLSDLWQHIAILAALGTALYALSACRMRRGLE